MNKLERTIKEIKIVGRQKLNASVQYLKNSNLYTENTKIKAKEMIHNAINNSEILVDITGNVLDQYAKNHSFTISITSEATKKFSSLVNKANKKLNKIYSNKKIHLGNLEEKSSLFRKLKPYLQKAYTNYRVS